MGKNRGYGLAMEGFWPGDKSRRIAEQCMAQIHRAIMPKAIQLQKNLRAWLPQTLS